MCRAFRRRLLHKQRSSLPQQAEEEAASVAAAARAAGSSAAGGEAAAGAGSTQLDPPTQHPPPPQQYPLDESGERPSMECDESSIYDSLQATLQEAGIAMPDDQAARMQLLGKLYAASGYGEGAKRQRLG